MRGISNLFLKSVPGRYVSVPYKEYKIKWHVLILTGTLA